MQCGSDGGKTATLGVLGSKPLMRLSGFGGQPHPLESCEEECAEWVARPVILMGWQDEGRLPSSASGLAITAVYHNRGI
jgi:hypothetical protein